MRRNVCDRIEEISGTKSTKIMELINRKLQLRKEKMLDKHINDKILLALKSKFDKAKIEFEEAQQNLKKREEELDLEYRTIYPESGQSYLGYRIKDWCRISKEDFNLLQKAQDLWSIGRKQDAKDIWSKLIKKHKLFEEDD